MKRAILRSGQPFYTYLGPIFQAIDHQQVNYNWLITECVCYPPKKDLEDLFWKPYIWLSGTELTEIIQKHDIQFVWGVFSGFNKAVQLEEILKFNLPYADENKNIWAPDPHIQHPLAEIEMIAWDSTLTILMSKNEETVDLFREAFPLSEDF